MAAGSGDVLVGPTSGAGPVTSLYTDPASAVVYDPGSDRIYFGGPQMDEIRVGAADGSGDSLLYSVDNPRDIAIDPSGNRIFWVDLDNVWSAPLDGSGTPSAIFSDMGFNLGTIAFYPLADLLYLGELDGDDSGNDRDLIWTANADGTGTRTVLYDGNLGGIRGIDVVSEAPAALTALLLVTGLAGIRLTRRG